MQATQGLIFLTLLLPAGLGQNYPKAPTPRGLLLGKYESSRNGSRYESYLGIRYGHVAKRFDASIPTETWDGPKYAHKFGPICAQIVLGSLETIGVEDCLYLNVYTPRADSQKRAVMVYIHGGGFVVGSTLEYGGKYFSDEDIVVVTVAYRMGVLGFLNTFDDSVSGNNGLKDQILALKWVQENIETFGGDKNRVMISGNSAGGASVLSLLLSPLGAGLFHAVYGQSGTPANFWAYSDSQKPAFEEVAQTLNCPSFRSSDLVECFKTAPLKNLLLAQKKTVKWSLHEFTVGPTLEAKSRVHEPFMTAPPQVIMKEGWFPKIPVLLTMTKDEGSLILGSVVIRREAVLNDLNENRTTVDPIAFAYNHYPSLMSRTDVSKRVRDFYFGSQLIRRDQEQELVDLFSDTWFVRGIRKTARLIGSHTPVYLGLFSYKRHDSYSPIAAFGYTERIELVSHCEDLSYMFDDTGVKNPFPHVGQLTDKRDIEFSRKYVKMLADFAKTGVPSVPFAANTKWNPLSKSEIDRDSLNFLNLDEVTHVIKNPFEKRMKFWDDLQNECQTDRNEL